MCRGAEQVDRGLEKNRTILSLSDGSHIAVSLPGSTALVNTAFKDEVRLHCHQMLRSRKRRETKLVLCLGILASSSQFKVVIGDTING